RSKTFTSRVRARRCIVHRRPADCHDRRDDTVDLFPTSLLVRLDIAGRVLADGHVVRHPPEHRVTTVAKKPSRYEPLELLGRRAHGGVALPELDHRYPVAKQLDRQLTRVPRDIRKLDSLIPVPPSVDLFANEPVVHHIA